MTFADQNHVEMLERRLKSIENRLGGISYDMRAIAKQELVSNSTTVQQAEMQFGMYTALCIETIDIWKQNRIRFYCPLFHDPKQTVKKLPWANAVSSLGGFDDSGCTWVPPAGSTVCIMFENGNRASPFYIGTTWHRNRGPDGQHNWGYNIEEYYKIHEGKRNGYLVGPNDGSQVFPPWNTENYNGFDLSSLVDFASNPEAQRLITYPHIYGFKTPQKHYIKMVDGDAKCNYKWKRFEIMSSCGNWIMMKDDHLHYSGQWAHPECGGNIVDGETSCIEGSSVYSLQDTLQGGFVEITDDIRQQLANIADATPKDGKKKEELDCEGKRSNIKIIGGHPATGNPDTKYYKSQIGANPFFKHKQECRPYKGAPTPQNNMCDLPQSGIQIMSISGHTFVMDDSVEEPSKEPSWDREFDFGCNDHYVGRTYWRSATGHLIEMSDVESPPGDNGSNLRGKDNYIKILTATGNSIELNDHTESQINCPGCPPNIGGSERGIHLRSTSNHTIDMVDEANEQCGSCRMDGGVPVAKAKKAFVRIRTGYGLEMSFNDTSSQEDTQNQYVQIFCPQKDNSDGGPGGGAPGGGRGPHIHRYQEAFSGPGLVFLRVGGNYVVSTFDNHYTVVGDEEKNPADLVEVVTKMNVVYTKDNYMNLSDKKHLFLAKEIILLLAGQDIPNPNNNCELGPNFGSVIVYDYSTGCVRLSDRVFASTSSQARQLSIFDLEPFRKCPPPNLSCTPTNP